MAAAPLPPPPPPPYPVYAYPGLGMPQGVPYAWPPTPPPGWTRRGLAAIRKAIRYYEIVLIIQIVVGFVGALTVALIGGVYLGGSSLTGGAVTPTQTGTVLSPGTILLSAASGTLALAALIVLVISWLEWRGAIKSLVRSGSEHGPQHAADLVAAERDYGRTVAMFVTNFVVSLGAVLVVTFYDLGQAIQRAGVSGTVSFPTQSFLLELVVILLVSAVFSVLTYYFAGRSLTRAIATLVPAAERGRLEDGRRWLLVGAVIGPVTGVAALEWQLGALLAVVPTLLLLYGMRLIAIGYDSWLVPAAALPPPMAGVWRQGP